MNIILYTHNKSFANWKTYHIIVQSKLIHLAHQPTSITKPDLGLSKTKHIWRIFQNVRSFLGSCDSLYFLGLLSEEIEEKDDSVRC